LQRSSWAERSAIAVTAAVLLILAAALLPGGLGRGNPFGGSRVTTAIRATPDFAADGSHVGAEVRLTRPGRISRYAFVDVPVHVHTAPSPASPVIGRLGTTTEDGTDELVLALGRRTGSDGKKWLRVRTPLKHAGTVGWVRRDHLSTMRRVETWLQIDRRRRLVTLVRDGEVIFRASAGVGTTATPTPAGAFYVRDRLTGLDPASLYGAAAFGTSARSDKVTDWPGGSVVGIHGTNEPGRLPGAVSHGCVRLRNSEILRLARLMPVGTPVTIR
jgi:hypothetical protein